MIKAIRRELALGLAKKAIEIYAQCLDAYLAIPEGSALWAFVRVKEAFGDFLRAIAFAIDPRRNT